MRIQGAALEELHAMLDDVVTRNDPSALAAYKDSLRDDDGVTDVDKRFRWDLFWATQPADRYAWIDGQYADGVVDAHIDTALRRWVAARLDR